MDIPIENQRVKQVIDHYCGGNELKFSNEIGIAQPRINRLFSVDKRNDKYPIVSFEIVQAIINKYIDVSAEWLLTGRGEMERDVVYTVVGRHDDDARAKGEADKVFKLRTDRDVPDQSIPLYNIEASAGIVTLFKDTKEFTPIDYLHIPNLPKCDGALYVTGDSMYPLLKSGDIVAYKQIQDFVNDIFWGEMYLVSVDIGGEEMVTIKYVQKSEKEGYIKLVSQNKHHQDKEIQMSKLRAMAIVKASVRINSMS